MATADTVPVTVEARKAWFAEFDPAKRPLWVFCEAEEVLGWLALRSFYGRPAYHATVETAVYVDPGARRRGIGRTLLTHALEQAPTLGVRTMLGFIFAHNVQSIALFEGVGFSRWGHLPNVAELDGAERDLAIFGRRVS